MTFFVQPNKKSLIFAATKQIQIKNDNESCILVVASLITDTLWVAPLCA